MQNLAARDPQVAIVGYDQDEVQRFAQVVKSVAPWANDKTHPMTNQEIGLSVRRALSMGLDPLNPHEVQIWKDGRGNINFQLAYTLMIEWVKRFKGDHTEPQYERLTDEQMEDEGIPPSSIAYRVRFIMKDDLNKMMELLNMKIYDAREVRSMFEVTGVGVADASEWNKAYFSPNGRSKAMKVQKRALVDAYRRKFGTPTRSEIEAMRRDSALPQISVEDWEKTAAIEDLSAQERTRVAEEFAKDRTIPELSVDDKRDAVNALFSGAVEGEFTEAPPEPPTPPEPEPPTEDHGDPWAQYGDAKKAAEDAGLTVDSLPGEMPFDLVKQATKSVKIATRGIVSEGRPVEAAQNWLDSEFGALNIAYKERQS